MTASERLQTIENQTQGTIPTEIWDDHQWLIERVHTLEKRNERLRKALESLSHRDCAVHGRCPACVARKALSDEGAEG